MKYTQSGLETEINVLADFTTSEVVIKTVFADFKTNPTQAMRTARALMRAAFTLGYVEPSPAKASPTALGVDSVVVGVNNTVPPEKE